MFKILPFLAVSNLVLPNGNSLPVELWALILRFLDPASLLIAARSNTHWSSICKGDPVLRTKVRRQLALERQRYQEEMLNPGRLITVKREGYEVMLLMGSSKTEKVLVDLYGINSRVSGRNLINP
ncbi:hypothetical protein MTP99_013302 [Tenebrio molitor]|nr:hypothetical protein MTP99_013302 [Tenebrio molitor]